MERTLQPEILDTLSPGDPAAVHNRRDLRWTNAVMGNHAWISRTLPGLMRPGERVLEVGAGTGELGLRLARQGIPIDGLDLWPRPETWPAAHAWHRADLRSFAGWDAYAVIIGNLIFHQFNDTELRALGAQFAAARVVVACEPHRRRASQIAYRVFAPLFGANHVSLHDAHVSIAAGFCDDELPRALGLDEPAWRLQCDTTPLGAYHLIASRPDHDQPAAH